jgi:hypothetical protein
MLIDATTGQMGVSGGKHSPAERRASSRFEPTTRTRKAAPCKTTRQMYHRSRTVIEETLRADAGVRHRPASDHDPVRVVGLGAICDLDQSPYAVNDERQLSLSASEFALLDNGERVILHAERGYNGFVASGNIWDHQTVETITHNVLNVVLPDDDDTEDKHPWEWLARLARYAGIDVTAEQLRQVAYEVVLTERLLRRLGEGAA